MREELKRNNSIGNTAGIDLLQKALFQGLVQNRDAVLNLYNYDVSIQLNPMAALSFFEELDILYQSKEKVYLTEFGKLLSKKDVNSQYYGIAKQCIVFLITNNLINLSKIRYDSLLGQIFVESNAFALSAAVFRNYLISINVLKVLSNGFYIETNFEKIFEDIVSKERRQITQKELLNKLEKQRDDGEKAELFVLGYENKRLNRLQNTAKRISEIDVSAGYDILSYENELSTQFDRFIEVKSYWGKPHFYWSENERNTAILYGDRYYLYLVDMQELLNNQQSYHPFIIKNPSKTIENTSWLIEPVSFRITALD